MKPLAHLLMVLLGITVVNGTLSTKAEEHRATRLGNPETSFAPTVYWPADLRQRFADPQLHPDITEILKQWGWPGNVDDLFAAAATNEIVEWSIPVGNTMPFMSSRDHGKPVCLRNVTWAGLDPIHAFAFTFHSNGHLWRCVTPKPCSNFFVEDLGPEPIAALTLDCMAPDNVVLGHTVQVCLNVHNTGNISGTNIAVVLTIPTNSEVVDTTEAGTVTNNSVSWAIGDMVVGDAKEVCVALKARQTGVMNFNAVASSLSVHAVPSQCSTEVTGLPAILLEKSDNPDPVSVGSNTTYTVKVTNQGSADDKNVAIHIEVDSELVPISSDNPGATISGQTVTFPIIAVLAAKQVITNTIQARGVSAGDAHTKFIVSSDMLTSPLTAEESTTVY